MSVHHLPPRRDRNPTARDSAYRNLVDAEQIVAQLHEISETANRNLEEARRYWESFEPGGDVRDLERST